MDNWHSHRKRSWHREYLERLQERRRIIKKRYAAPEKMPPRKG